MTEFWNAWNWNPLVGGFLALVGWRYMDGVWRLWRRAGAGRGVHQWQVAAFWSSVIVLFIALISPIDIWSTTSLSMHMIQHLLLMVLAPSLMVLGLPPIARISMLPMPWRRDFVHWWHRQHFLKQAWKWLTAPFTTWGLYALVLWIWHLPSLYEAAVVNPIVHMIEHSSFFGTALLFWWAIAQHRVLGIFLVFTTAIHSSILGALMTFSDQVWYPLYGSFQDQQLAGLIMWMSGGSVFLVAGLLLLWQWLYEMEKNDAKISI